MYIYIYSTYLHEISRSNSSWEGADAVGWSRPTCTQHKERMVVVVSRLFGNVIVNIECCDDDEEDGDDDDDEELSLLLLPIPSLLETSMFASPAAKGFDRPSTS